jgi:hypothetical protein
LGVLSFHQNYQGGDRYIPDDRGVFHLIKYDKI